MLDAILSGLNSKAGVIGVLLAFAIPYTVMWAIWLFNRYARYTDKRYEFAAKMISEAPVNSSQPIPCVEMAREYCQQHAFFKLFGIKNTTKVSREFLSNTITVGAISPKEALTVHSDLIFYGNQYIDVNGIKYMYNALAAAIGLWMLFLISPKAPSHVLHIVILLLALLVMQSYRSLWHAKKLNRISRKLSKFKKFSFTVKGQRKVSLFREADFITDQDLKPYIQPSKT